MNKQALVLFVLIAGLIAIGFEAHAKAPREIPYQGFLESNGQPAEGDHDFRFTLWGDNNNLWTDTLTLYVATGKFSVVLGAATPIPEHAFSVQTLEVAIEVRKTGSGDAFKALGGRQRISSTAFAVRSRETDALPPGMIMPYYGKIDATHPVPEGWIVANGTIIDKNTNPHLAALVTHLRASNLITRNPNGLNTSGQPLNVNQARLPDLANVFLRGQGGGTNGNYYASQNKYHNHSVTIHETEQTHSHNSYAEPSHNHKLEGRQISISNDDGTWDVFYVEGGTGGGEHDHWTNNGGGHDHTIANTSTDHEHTGTVGYNPTTPNQEARPNTVVVYWLIKY